ncbi:MAG: NAD(P)-dependent oxidoreductase [Chitinispirillales bacterium]|jgi:siroheme synthase-like protein|nr:NAD(P)-dependent oxidoreductase [Chitinispirillales bacterium]
MMTNQKTLFPIFIDINGKKALVAGGGNVAVRRIRTLAAFGADITVISPNVTEYIEQAALSIINTNIDTDTAAIRLIKRKYEDGDIAAVNPFLVIAATDDSQVNRAIMTEAKSLNIPVSVAGCRNDCTFYFPAIAESGNYIAGIISKDGNHAGVKLTAEKIRKVING